MADYNQVAKLFVAHYYDTFDSNRENLATLYRDHSMMTYEGGLFSGVGNIMQKYLTGIGLEGRIWTHKASMNAQPCNDQGGILVNITGHIFEEKNVSEPTGFSQTFQLLVDGTTGHYYVLNDIFAIVFGIPKPKDVKYLGQTRPPWLQEMIDKLVKQEELEEQQRKQQQQQQLGLGR